MTAGKPRNRYHQPLIGTTYVHTIIDDHSRVAYAKIHDDETATTGIAVLRRAVTWYFARGVITLRVLRQRQRLPQPRLARGLRRARHNAQADPALPAGLYVSESARRRALPAWLHEYNHHRPHATIGKDPPVTRLTNLPGH